MSDVTVYCAAPASEVVPHLGDLSDYIAVEDGNDTYTAYQSLVEMWEPTTAKALSRARQVAETLSRAGISTGISLDAAPTPYVSVAASA